MPSIVQRVFHTGGFPHPWDASDFSLTLGNATNTPRQVGFTYAEIVRLLYGVKTFRLQGTANGTNVSGGTPWSTNFDKFLPAGLGSTVFADETALITYGGVLLQDIDITPPFSSSTAYISFFPTGTTVASNSRTGETYYPYFTFGEWRASGGTSCLPRVGFAPAGGSYSSFNVTGTFPFGKTVNVVVNYLPTIVNVSSVTWSFTASEFWPYDPGDGSGPIYNSTTGAAIRSPFPPL